MQSEIFQECVNILIKHGEYDWYDQWDGVKKIYTLNAVGNFGLTIKAIIQDDHKLIHVYGGPFRSLQSIFEDGMADPQNAYVLEDIHLLLEAL